MQKIIDFVTERPIVVVVALLLIGLPLGYYYFHPNFRNDLDIFFAKDDPELKAYKAFQSVYGNDEVALIIVSSDDVFDLDQINVIRGISAMLLQNEHVQRVFSLTEEEDPVADGDTIAFKKIIKEGDLSPSEIKAIRVRVLSDDILVKNLISEDGRNAIIVVEFEPFQGDQARHEILTDIRSRAIAIAGDRARLRFSGAYIDEEMYTLSGRDYRVFTPITLIIIFVCTVVIIRSPALSILCMVNLGLILIFSMGVFTLSGETINMVTTVIAPILMAVSIADAIHLLFHYRDKRAVGSDAPKTAVRESVMAVWLPCLFTTLTTSVGFLSFLVSTVRPPRIVGLFTAAGVAIALFLTLTWLPAVLTLAGPRFARPRRGAATGTGGRSDRRSGHHDRFERLLLVIADFTLTRYKTIGLMFVLVLGVSVLGLLKIRFETNISSYLPDGSPAKSDLYYLRDRIGGYSALELIVTAKSEAADFTHAESLQLADRLKRDLMREFDLTSPLALSDYFKKMNRAFNQDRQPFYRIPENREDILDFYELADPEILEHLVSPDRMETRISLRFLWSSTEKAKAVLDQVESYLAAHRHDDFTFHVNGRNKLYILMVTNLKTSQLRSFFSAFCLIFFMMIAICKNLKLALLSMIPNLFPIVTTLGIMGWTDIPLNVTNIMIASVTIGIAVDDTIHFITWFRRNSLAGTTMKAAIMQTFRDVGKPLVTTTVVLCLGFFVLVFGSITPTRTFGLLTGLSLFFALLADLFFLPPLILLAKPRMSPPPRSDSE